MLITSPPGSICVLSLLLLAGVLPSVVRAESAAAAAGDADYDDNNIVLYACDWQTSYLTNLIAQQIINENILLYNDANNNDNNNHTSSSNNKRVVIDYSISADRDIVLTFINGTTVPHSSSAAALEIWPGAFHDEAYDTQLENLGENGLIASVGWYVPGYVVEEYPESVYWEFYTRESTAEIFATVETAPLGRFLGLDPGYGDNIITEQNIQNHQMPLKQIYSGGDAATIDILTNVTSARLPILLYWWNPRDNTAKYDLRRVALPPITESCVLSYSSNDGTYDCDFIPEHPVKIATLGLKESHPDVYTFLQNYQLTNEYYEIMLAQIDGGDHVEDVAKRWVAENEDVWMPMLLEKESSPTTDVDADIDEALSNIPDGGGSPPPADANSVPTEKDSSGDRGGRITIMPALGTTVSAALAAMFFNIFV